MAGIATAYALLGALVAFEAANTPQACGWGESLGLGGGKEFPCHDAREWWSVWAGSSMALASTGLAAVALSAPLGRRKAAPHV